LKFTLFGFPVMVNYLYGRKNDFFELGVGVTYFLSKPIGKQVAPRHEYTISGLDVRIPEVMGTFMVGWRHVPTGRGLTYGVTFNPLVANSFRFPSVGLKIGYKLG
jgi:hypothetical protein